MQLGSTAQPRGAANGGERGEQWLGVSRVSFCIQNCPKGSAFCNGTSPVFCLALFIINSRGIREVILSKSRNYLGFPIN